MSNFYLRRIASSFRDVRMVTSLAERTAANLPPSLGELRFTPASRKHANSRFDFAVVKASQAFYAGVGKAL